MTEYFNPSTYIVIDRVTGEEVNMQIFIERVSENGWEKAFAKVVAEYIDCGGDRSSKFLAYLIKKKQRNNLINGTQKELSAESGVSIACVKNVVRRLMSNGLLKMVRSGTYMITPKMMRHGAKIQGVLMMKVWDSICNTSKLSDEAFDETA